MKKGLLSVLMLASLAGCTQNDVPEVFVSGNDGLVEIRLKSVTGPLAASTRAPFIGEIGADNQLTAKVLLTKDGGGFVAGSAITSGTMVFDANKTSTELWNTKNYYPADDSPVFLCGLHPEDAAEGATKWAQGTDEATMTYVFDGKTDVMAADKVETKKSEAQEGTYKDLLFRHLLTNLIIKVEADVTDGMTLDKVKAAWGNITGIELQKAGGAAPANKITVTLNGGTASTASAFSVEGTYGVGFYGMSGKNFPKTGTTPADPFRFTEDAFASTAIPATAEAIAYSMIAPVVSAEDTDDFTLLVKTANNTTGVEVPVNLSATGDTQGQYCIVTLKFRNTTIHASASVEEWKKGSTADKIIQ